MAHAFNRVTTLREVADAERTKLVKFDEEAMETA